MRTGTIGFAAFVAIAVLLVIGIQTCNEYSAEGEAGFVLDGIEYVVLTSGENPTVGVTGCAEYVGSDVDIGPLATCNDIDYVVTSILETFSEGAGVETVRIPPSVETIEQGALDNPSLVSIVVDGANQAYSSISGVLYDKSASTLIKFPASKKSITISSTVSAISEDAFRGSDLKTLRFKGAPIVGSHAFADCDSLRYVVFSDGMNSDNMPSDAFEGCVFHDADGSIVDFDPDVMCGHKYTGTDGSSLNLYTPKIGGVFSQDTLRYKIISNGDEKTVIVRGQASGTSFPENVLKIPTSVDYLGFDWTVTSVASKAFMGNDEIEVVSSAVDIGFKSFARCGSLMEVRLSGLEIGSYAFACCKSLVLLSLNDIAEIGKSAFSGCTTLSEIGGLENVHIIHDHAFFGCSLYDVQLSSIEEIGLGAFTGNALSWLAFSEDVKSIDDKAFFGYRFYDADGCRLSVSTEDLSGLSFRGDNSITRNLRIES